MMELSNSTTDDVPGQRISERFCTPNADLIFISSDNVLFKIHSTSICPLTTIGFPKISESIAVASDPVHLSEPATVLELLFQFIEPPSESQSYRQPSLIDISPKLLLELAEASEKYVVYGAMNICTARLSSLVASHPLEVLNHCIKHGYKEHVDQAASFSIAHSLEEAVAKLTNPGLLSRWLIYYSQWRTVAAQAVLEVQNAALSASKCRLLPNFAIIYCSMVSADPSRTLQMPSPPEPYKSWENWKCSTNHSGCSDLAKFLDDITKKLKFPTKFPSAK